MTWTQVNAMPDIASNNRYKVFFPIIQGVGDTKPLSELVHTITLPQNSLGHIQIRLYGHTVAFRGGRVFDNTVQIRFQENVRGEALNLIERWKNIARNRDNLGNRKQRYAGSGRVEIYDTTGAIIHGIPLVNMWPMTVEYPDLDEGGSAPLEFSATFSVDFAELEIT